MRYVVEFKDNFGNWHTVEKPFTSYQSAELFAILSPFETRIAPIYKSDIELEADKKCCG